jgi:pectate lyase
MTGAPLAGACFYDYRPLASAAAVENHVLPHAGTGRRHDRP